ncbi:hypothetical protein [Demequina sp. NBRC 110055]|uniref:hypothetical protein n=1 Tax=Demequina sp. NBRC 110055 TaxID=1570344 RepID=UPI000A05C597|nr:hypothetical protein [Demequina sp. NBRC 110055]
MSEAAEARVEADAAASAAGVVIRPLGATETWDAAVLLQQLWGNAVIEAPLMAALRHSGAYVAGAYTDARLVAACVGYFAVPLGDALHSHVAGVAPEAARRGIGLALKLDQRAWCLERGLTRVTWTFDPLVARNAAFNIGRLGVSVEEYLVDFYGEMADAVNVGQGSDRLLVAWDLTRPVGVHGGALPATPSALRVPVPADIESLRRSDPAQAADWRARLRTELNGRIGRGWSVTGFDDHSYLLEQTP